MIRVALKKQFDRIVYTNPLINKILRNLNKVLQPYTSFRLRPFGEITIRTGGTRFRMETNETSYVTKQLFWKGAGNFEYTPIFCELIKKCETFIDVGANTGYYSLLAASINNRVSIHAFEPGSDAFYYLQKNVNLNHYAGRIRTNATAVSNQDGEVIFLEIINQEGSTAKHNLSGVGGIKKTHETQERSMPRKVKSQTLDTYVSALGLEHVSLIKIDTEATEDLVLEGAAAVIRKHRPIIICETLFNKIEHRLETLMKQHGYSFFNHVNGSLQPTESIIREQDNGVRDCFFVHPEKIKLIEPSS